MIFAVIGVALIAFLITRTVPALQNVERSEPTTVLYTGTFVADENNEYFVLYQTELEPTVVPVAFDPLSACVADRSGAPCLVMSEALDAAFVGKPVTVEGSMEGEAVLVRKMMVIEDNLLPRTPATGSVFISWPDAVRLVESCEARGITQTHALDVYLELPDGSSVRAVEPSGDEVFRVFERVRDRCPAIPIATE